MPKIEKDIPIPVKSSNLPVSRDLPFRDMAVGDSIFFACPHELCQNVSARMHGYAKDMIAPSKIMTRKVEGGIRAWRVS